MFEIGLETIGHVYCIEHTDWLRVYFKMVEPSREIYYCVPSCFCVFGYLQHIGEYLAALLFLFGPNQPAQATHG